MGSFPDNFSDQAAAYSRHRPRYPAEVFSFVAGHAPARDRVWDCATGNGQAATGLPDGSVDVVYVAQALHWFEIDRFHDEVVGAHWPPQTKWSHAYCRGIPFPFEELDAPSDLAVSAVWRLAGLLGYIESWSATQRYKKSLGEDPVAGVRAELEQVWGAAETEREVSWPLVVRVGRPA